MREYIFLLLITYTAWAMLAKIISQSKLKNVWIMVVLCSLNIFLCCFIVNKIHLSEKLFIIIGLWLILNNNPREKLKTIGTLLVFSNVIEMFITALEKIFNFAIINTIKYNIIVMLIYLCGLSVIYIMNKYKSSREKQQNFDVVIYILICVLGLAVNGVTDYFRYNTDKIYEYSVVLAVYGVFCSVLSIVYIMYIVINNNMVQKYYDMEKNLNEEQKIYYEMLLEKEEETRKFRHDITNQLINIRRLAEETDDKKVAEYVKGLSCEIENIGEMVYKTGNRIIDIMLNYYISKLDKGIQVHISGMITDKIRVSDSDLNIIFGNIFKNIWEELKYCDDGYIRIECTLGSEFCSITIENSLDKNMKNQSLKKTEGNNFGYGTENIKKAAKRNGVVFECEKTDKKYCSKFVFKNKK